MSVPSTFVTCITRSVVHVMLGASEREATRNGTAPVRRLATPNKRNSTSNENSVMDSSTAPRDGEKCLGLRDGGKALHRKYKFV